MIVTNIWHRFSGVRFVFIGLFNTLVDFSILNVLIFAFGLNKIVANTISVSIAMIISFLLNKFIVFRHNEKNNTIRFVKFIVITAFGLYVLQNVIVFLFIHHIVWPGLLATNLIHWIGLKSFSEQFVTINFAKALATGVTMIWNYFLYKKFVFNQE